MPQPPSWRLAVRDMDMPVRPRPGLPAAIPIPAPPLRLLAARAAAFPAWQWQSQWQCRRALHAATALPIVPMPLPSPQSATDFPLEDPGMGALGDPMPPRPLRTQQPSMVVFSGGTAFNGVVEELKKFTTRVAHVLPVSDDGGSTAEIVRVLGGPAVGDIRSRCMRLSDEGSAEALAVRRLLGHRLPFDDIKAKAEWYKIVEGEHLLWEGVSGPYRETIRAFLVHFQSQILQRSYERFRFSNGRMAPLLEARMRSRILWLRSWLVNCRTRSTRSCMHLPHFQLLSSESSTCPARAPTFYMRFTPLSMQPCLSSCLRWMP